VPPPASAASPAGAALDALAPGAAPVELAGLAAGGPALVFFYRGDCPASEAAAPALPRFAEIPRLAVAAVSQDGAGETVAFARAHGWAPGLRVLVDPEPWATSNAWGVAVTPTFVLLAPGGRVEEVVEGWSRAEANALAARASALAGAPPVVVSSPEDGGPAFRPG
jgi:hypothetical protein